MDCWLSLEWCENPEFEKFHKSLLTTLKIKTDLCRNWWQIWIFNEMKRRKRYDSKNQKLATIDCFVKCCDNDITSKWIRQLWHRWWKSNCDFEYMKHSLAHAQNRLGGKEFYVFSLQMTNDFAVDMQYKTRIFTRMMWSQSCAIILKFIQLCFAR